VEDCLWELADNRVIEITLQKINRMGWWRAVIVGEPELDLSKASVAEVPVLCF
jgi:choline kinase